jgi:hypothetical protein
MRYIILAFVVIAMIPKAVVAACLAPTLRVNDEFFISDLVFTGTITRQAKTGVDASGDWDGHDLTWQVSRVYRGDIKGGDAVQTHTENDSGRFPTDIEDSAFSTTDRNGIGKSFLIFAHRVDTVYEVDNCGNSRNLLHASSQIKQLRAIPRNSQGEVYGFVFGKDGAKLPWTPLVTAVCGDKKIVAAAPASKKEINFRMTVPSGRCSIVMHDEHYTFEPYDLSYKKPDDFFVPKGGSAGIALWAIPAKH